MDRAAAGQGRSHPRIHTRSPTRAPSASHASSGRTSPRLAQGCPHAAGLARVRLLRYTGRMRCRRSTWLALPLMTLNGPSRLLFSLRSVDLLTRDLPGPRMCTRLVALPTCSCKKAMRVWSPRSTKNSLLDVGMTVMGAPPSKSMTGTVAAERSSHRLHRRGLRYIFRASAHDDFFLRQCSVCSTATTLAEAKKQRPQVSRPRASPTRGERKTEREYEACAFGRSVLALGLL
jgi:hypothetical protein